MPTRPSILALLAVLCLPLPSLAQSAGTAADDDPAEVAAEPSDERDALDVGILQAELARLEAERQRLADALAAGSDPLQIEQLAAQNSDLQEQLSILQAIVDQQRQDEQHTWFIVGGSTVAVSLLTGWLLAQFGGRRKRSMWLN